MTGLPKNNCVEIQAAKRAIEQAACYGIDALCVNTESKFLINAMTRWIFGWKKYNWMRKDGSQVENERDFRALEKVKRKSGMQVMWSYVPKRSKDYGNYEADRLAREGAEMYRELYHL